MSLTLAETEAINRLRAYVKKNRIGHTLAGGKRDPIGEPEGMVAKPNDLMVSAATAILCKDIADILVKRWPGFRWAIQPNEFGKVFNVFCLDFHEVWGYVIRYDDIMNDPKRREAYKAGREILRRFRYHGQRYDPMQIAGMPRNAKGQCIPDVSDLKATRFTRQADLQHRLATGKARVVVQDGKGNQIIEVSK